METRLKKNNNDVIININENIKTGSYHLNFSSSTDNEQPIQKKYDLEHVLPEHFDKIASYLSYNPDLIHLKQVSKKMNALVDQTGAEKLAREIADQIHLYEQFHPIFNKMLSSFKCNCYLIEVIGSLGVCGGISTTFVMLCLELLLKHYNANFHLSTAGMVTTIVSGAVLSNSLFFAKKIYNTYGFFKRKEQSLIQEMREPLKLPIPALYEPKDEDESKNDPNELNELIIDPASLLRI